MSDPSAPRPAWRQPSTEPERRPPAERRRHPQRRPARPGSHDRLEPVGPPREEQPEQAAEPPEEPSHSPPTEAEEPTAPPPLRRLPHDGLIAGVCTGLGRSLGVDPVILRVAFVLLALAGGSGILLYLILAAVMPRERPGERAPAADPSRVAALRRITGWAFIVLGAVLLVGRFVPGVDQVVWPVALLALGAAVLVQSART